MMTRYTSRIVPVIMVLAALACNLSGSSAPPPETATATSTPIVITPGAPLAVLPTATNTPVVLPSQPPTAIPTAVLPPTAIPTAILPPTVTDAPVACDAVITQAIEQVDDICAGTGRNEACYGHDRVTAAFRAPASGPFNAPGNRVALEALTRLETSPFDPVGNLWGIALLKVQADLPDTLPGQAITVIAYGNTTIEDAGGAAPMQAVYITTGLGGPGCETVPESGVLIQNDAEAVASLTVNGVELAIGSTVLVQARPNEEMTLAVLEGQVDAIALGQRTVAAAGSQIRVRLGGVNRLQPMQPPLLEMLDMNHLQRQPMTPLLDVLPERIALPQPLTNLDLQLPPLIVTRLPRDSTRPPLLSGTRPFLPVTPTPTVTLPLVTLQPEINLPGPMIISTPVRMPTSTPTPTETAVIVR